MFKGICWAAFFLWIVFITANCFAADPPEKNYLINDGFEAGLTGWTAEGEVAQDNVSALKGRSSLRIGPGKGAIRQRYKINGLRIVTFGATLKADSPEIQGMVRAQCYDANDHLLMDLTQPLDTKKPDTKEHELGIYFKTHAHTAILVVSIERTTANPGYLYADAGILRDYDHDRKEHRPTCNLDQYMQPLWKSSTVYNETVLLLSEDGKPASGKLLFTPKRILSVRDYSLLNTYVKSRDYTVDGKVLTATASSSIPSMKDTDFPKGEYPWLSIIGKQVVVTYTHEDHWQGPVPHYEGDQLPHTIKKLNRHSPLTIVAMGDSITLGNNTSGFVQSPPHMPTWAELSVGRLKKIYGYKGISLYNTALGGMTSAWGLDNADSAVASLKPDLVIIAFGMNDFWSVSKEEFRENIKGMIDRVRARQPNAEFVLVASMRFDPAYTAEPQYSGHLTEYRDALVSLTSKGICLLDMTEISEALYKAKKPKDLISDPLHPNDFLARWYAQGLTALLNYQ